MKSIDKEIFSELNRLPFDFEAVKDGSRLVWRYKGNVLSEAVKLASIVRRKGGTFYDHQTGQPFGTHREDMEKQKALLLLAMHQMVLHEGRESFCFPDDFPDLGTEHVGGFTRNYSYLAHFGLVRKETKGGKVHYKLTQHGHDFASGKEATFRHVINHRADVLYRGPRDLYITDLIGDKPLFWWRKNAA